MAQASPSAGRIAGPNPGPIPSAIGDQVQPEEHIIWVPNNFKAVEGVHLTESLILGRGLGVGWQVNTLTQCLSHELCSSESNREVVISAAFYAYSL